MEIMLRYRPHIFASLAAYSIVGAGAASLFTRMEPQGGAIYGGVFYVATKVTMLALYEAFYVHDDRLALALGLAAGVVTATAVTRKWYHISRGDAFRLTATCLMVAALANRYYY